MYFFLQTAVQLQKSTKLRVGRNVRRAGDRVIMLTVSSGIGRLRVFSRESYKQSRAVWRLHGEVTHPYFACGLMQKLHSNCYLGYSMSGAKMGATGPKS